MSRPSINALRFDPYKDFKFRVKWDNRYVAGLSRISGLNQTTEAVTHREGGDPVNIRKSSGQTTFDPITLEVGVTHDPEFEKWARSVSKVGSKLDADVSLKETKKDLTIEMFDEAGQLVTTYKVYGCWISDFQSSSELDAEAHAVAIYQIVLEHEGLKVI